MRRRADRQRTSRRPKFGANLTATGFPTNPAEALLRFTGMGAADVRNELARDGREDFDAFAAAWHSGLHVELARGVAPMDRIEGRVGALECRVCVASNSSHEGLRRRLGQTPLWPLLVVSRIL